MRRHGKYNKEQKWEEGSEIAVIGFTYNCNDKDAPQQCVKAGLPQSVYLTPKKLCKCMCAVTFALSTEILPLHFVQQLGGTLVHISTVFPGSRAFLSLSCWRVLSICYGREKDGKPPVYYNAQSDKLWRREMKWWQRKLRTNPKYFVCYQRTLKWDITHDASTGWGFGGFCRFSRTQSRGYKITSTLVRHFGT